MPPAAEITRQIAEAANQWIALSIAWHLVIAVALVALAFGWRPGRRATGLLLASLCMSVAAVSWLTGNPFNGTSFTALTAALAFISLRLPAGAAPARAPIWALIAGSVLLGFGLVYPHFLDGPAAMYLVAAPVGVAPCPSLAVVIGFILLSDGLASRAWCRVLLVAGAFYAIVGVWRLGVMLDVGLVAGTVALGGLLATARTRWTKGGTDAPGARRSAVDAARSRAVDAARAAG